MVCWATCQILPKFLIINKRLKLTVFVKLSSVEKYPYYGAPFNKLTITNYLHFKLNELNFLVNITCVEVQIQKNYSIKYSNHLYYCSFDTFSLVQSKYIFKYGGRDQ